MFFKCILAIVTLCLAIVKASLGALLYKAIVIILSPVCTPNPDEQDHELPTPNSDTARQLRHQSAQSKVQLKQHYSAEKSSLSSAAVSATRSEPQRYLKLELSQIPDCEDGKTQFKGVQKPLQSKDKPHSTGRLRLSSLDSWDIKIEPQGHLDSELKLPHTAERPKISSEEDRDKKIKPESSEIKQPHSTARKRLSSAASDTKSESDGGYLASESSESPESETQFRRKNSNKDRHSARPPGSTSSDSSDGERGLLNPSSIAHITASDTAALARPHITQAQVGPMSNAHLFSENGNESLSDGDYMILYTEPCEEQNPQAYVYNTTTLGIVEGLHTKMKQLEVGERMTPQLTNLCLVVAIAILLCLLLKYYQRVLVSRNCKPLTRTTGTQTEQNSGGQNEVNSKPPRPPDRTRTRSSTTARATSSELGGYLASGSSDSLNSDDTKTRVKQRSSNIEKHHARPRSLTDSESLTSSEGDQTKIAVTMASVCTGAIDEVLDLKGHTQLCSGNENQSSSDGEYFQPCQEENSQAHSELVRASGHPMAYYEHMKTQAQITDLESKLNDLQASLQSTLESHLKSQSSIMSEQHKLLIELIERQKVENEELRKVLAETRKMMKSKREIVR